MSERKLGEPECLYMLQQGSEEWLKKRLGIVTASQLNVILTPKGKPAKGAKVEDFACKIAAERVFGFVEDSFQSFDMMRGHYEEEIARDIYDESFEEVHKCGFITRSIDGVRFGCSPDGLVLKDGGIEIKSRIPKFQIKTIILDEVPADYVNQTQGCLLASGRDWWDYVQYSNGLPLYVKRVLPDPVRIEQIATAVCDFEKIVLEKVALFEAKSASLIKTKRVKITYEDDVLLESKG